MKRFLVLVFAALAIAILPACQHRSLDPSGPYHGNESVASADAVILKTYDVIDRLLLIESTHRATLPASVTKAADDARDEAKLDLQNAVKARDVYLASPTDSNAAKFTTAVALLRASLAIAESYLPAVTE
jgi:hypothetical protein